MENALSQCLLIFLDGLFLANSLSAAAIYKWKTLGCTEIFRDKRNEREGDYMVEGGFTRVQWINRARLLI